MTSRFVITQDVSLNYLPEQFGSLRAITSQPHGLKIISGQANSGRSETLSRLVRGRNDVFVVDEARNDQSMKTAWKIAAQNNVWATVHAPSVTSLIGRLYSAGIPFDRLFDPDRVSGYINQSLVRTLCQQCSRPAQSAKRSVIMSALSESAKMRVRGPGCLLCDQGFSEWILVSEIMRPDKQLLNLLLELKGDLHHFRTEWASQAGGILKETVLLRRIEQGLVDPDYAQSML